MKPNPEYESAIYEGTVLDKAGNRLSVDTACALFNRPLPPRYNIDAEGYFVEVPAYLPPEGGRAIPVRT